MQLNQNYLYKIECAILNTFLAYPDCLEMDCELFKIEDKYFSTDFNKMICNRIMKEIEGINCLSLLQIKFDAWIRDIKPQYISQYLEIITQGVLPLSSAKKYYEELKLQHIERLCNGR